MSIYVKLDDIQWELLQEQMDEKNGYRGAYIPLAELLFKIKPICRKHGVVFYFTASETQLILKIFDKETREQLSPSPRVRLPVLTKDMKTEGGNYTYMKRYLLINTFLAIAESFDPEDTATGVPDKDSSNITESKNSNITSSAKETEHENPDINVGSLIVKAETRLKKKGLQDEEITSKAIKREVRRMKKWSPPQMKVINEYFKEKEEF